MWPWLELVRRSTHRSRVFNHFDCSTMGDYEACLTLLCTAMTVHDGDGQNVNAVLMGGFVGFLCG